MSEVDQTEIDLDTPTGEPEVLPENATDGQEEPVAENESPTNDEQEYQGYNNFPECIDVIKGHSEEAVPIAVEMLRERGLNHIPFVKMAVTNVADTMLAVSSNLGEDTTIKFTYTRDKHLRVTSIKVGLQINQLSPTTVIGPMETLGSIPVEQPFIEDEKPPKPPGPLDWLLGKNR